jgi:hypothetical protein
MCVGSDGLAGVKERIQAFRRELLQLAETESLPSQVVQVNFQLFPLTLDTANDAETSSHPAAKDVP